MNCPYGELFFYLSFNGGNLLMIGTDSTLTLTIALNEVEDVERSPESFVRVIGDISIFVMGEAIALNIFSHISRHYSKVKYIALYILLT